MASCLCRARSIRRFTRWTFALAACFLHGLALASEARASDAFHAWRQLAFDLRRGSSEPARWPALEDIAAAQMEANRTGVIPLAILDTEHPADPRRPGAERHIFAACALDPDSYSGAEVRFRIESAWLLTDETPSAIEVDTGDGSGWHPAGRERTITARYATTGEKPVTIRLRYADGRVHETSFGFFVRALGTPAPNDTLSVTGTIPYLGGVASGEAYIYLAPGHTALENPIVVVEGFDLDNSMSWEELYALLNREELLERLRALGYDAVVVNFDDATNYIQRNAFLLVEILGIVRGAVAPETSIALAGASMGGLVSRFALAYMETNGIPLDARVYVAFDSPHRGASIPLGIQYWVDFFSGESADAAALLAALDSPAARQMLVYHHTDPPGATGQPDPLRAAFLADLAAAGEFPNPRSVAIANGSGAAQDQGFLAGAQIIRWQFSDFLIDIVGDVWSVPDGTSRTIFHGVIDPIFFPRDELFVDVSGTEPYDNAPGGSRGSMAQMDAVVAPFGDIVALHDSHCFIPTTSALDLAGVGLFHDVASDGDVLTRTPFDAVYFPIANQEHVLVTAENADWLIAELTGTVVAVPDVAGAERGIVHVSPNPFGSVATIRLEGLPAGARCEVYDVGGRAVARLAPRFEDGATVATWDGSSAAGLPVPAGVYFVRVGGVEGSRVVRLVRR